MLTFFKSTPAGLATVETASPGCWIHAVAPDAEEIVRLREELGVPEGMIIALLVGVVFRRRDWL
jgi:hypothetical protein